MGLLDQKDKRENKDYKALREREESQVQRDLKVMLERQGSLEILENKDEGEPKEILVTPVMMESKVILDLQEIRVQEEILECKDLQEKR